MNLDKTISVLQQSSLFEKIEKESIGHLLNCLGIQIKRYEEQHIIIELESCVNEIGVVIEGEVEIVKENRLGDRMIVGILGEGQIFGEGIVCTKKRLSPVTVRTKTKATIALVPYEKIIMTCGERCSFHKQIIQNMLYVLGEKNYHLNQKIDYLILKGMREKLALYLLEQSYREGKASFYIGLNRNDLAEYLNVSRSAMSRELSRMKEDGLIDYYKNSFKIIDESRLKEYLV